MVEYASVTAAVALLAIALGGFQARVTERLPTTSAKALQLVDTGARAQKASLAGARAAYARAPYRKPVLRYLYALGWIGGSSHVDECRFASLADDTTRRRALEGIRRDASLVRRLRSLGVTSATAAVAVTRGLLSACS